MRRAGFSFSFFFFYLVFLVAHWPFSGLLSLLGLLWSDGKWEFVGDVGKRGGWVLRIDGEAAMGSPLPW